MKYLAIGIALLIPGGATVACAVALYRYIRRRQVESRIKRATFEAVMDASALNYTDSEWQRLYRKIMAEPETVYDDVPELGWKAKAITQRKWGRA